MTVVAVVQARVGSTRLPGKVLAPVGGMPLLELMLRRLQGGMAHRVVVATSGLERDDPVAELCAALSVPVVRGSESDVLARFMTVLDQFPADHIVRLTGDCPLMDPELVMRALEVHRASGADYTSNTIVRTFPDGLDVEVVKASALREAHLNAIAEEEREHVTPFVYRHPERYALESFTSPEFLGDERWTVDDAGDLEWVRGVVDGIGRIDFSWREVLEATPRRTIQGEGVRLVPAQDSSPRERVWVFEEHGEAAGSVRLVVTSGIGHATLDVPDESRVLAEQLLRQRLLADAQVTELVVPPPPM